METIYKLQPHRTMHLQGFGGGASVANGYGCTACLHDAGDEGFKITGVWGGQDEFAVLVLWDADNQFEHPRYRYLPNRDFSGISLAFDLEVDNCVRIDSDLFPWLDWAWLNVQYADGTVQQVKLIDHATIAAGEYVSASAAFFLDGSRTVGDYVGLMWTTGYTPSAMWHADYYVNPWDTMESIVAGIAAALDGSFGLRGQVDITSPLGIVVTWTGFEGSLLGKGANGNNIGVVASVSGAGTESWAPVWWKLDGGRSPSKWSVSIDLGGLSQPTAVQKMWLTFAPEPQAAAFEQTDFHINVTGWTVTDADGKRALKVAGPGSVRIESGDAWVTPAGYWEAAPDGWWSNGRAIRSAYSSAESRSVTVETHCGSSHDIYLGTRLDFDCGKIEARLDGGAPVPLDCYGGGANVRRLLFSDVAAGAHVVTITVSADKNTNSCGWYFYFDFLECAVPSDVPDAPEERTDIGVATDFDTDNAYKLAPQRLVWGIQKSGLVGEIDHYMGVFWWPVRKLLNAESDWAQVTTITFDGNPTFGETTSITIGDSTFSKINFITDWRLSIAKAFELIINLGSTIFRASAIENVLTLTGRASGSAYRATVTAATGSETFTATVATANHTADMSWGVDGSARGPVNAAVAAWHSDYFGVLSGAGMSAVVSFSDELVAPPDTLGAVWVQRFWDGAKVETATGLGTLKSSQMAFSAGPLAYISAAYGQIAELMSVKGLGARLQLGETLWWYQPNGSGMAYYDADTKAAFEAAHGGTALHHFLTPNDDPAAHSVDAEFLRDRLKAYVDGIRSSVSGATWELLWPLDVNDPDIRRLNRFVNLPPAWGTRDGSGFDTLMVEGFEYGGVDHNIDKARRCAAYPFAELAWPKEYCRYLMGLYYAGWPWQREYSAARRTGTPLLKIWAYDHLCLFGWPLPLPKSGRRAVIF